MLFNAAQASILLSALHLTAGTSPSQRKSFTLARRHDGPTGGIDGYGGIGGSEGYGSLRGDDSFTGYEGHDAVHGGYSGHEATDGYGGLRGDGYGGIGGNIGASGGIDTIVQQWGSLTSKFSQFQSTIAGGASIDVALKVATSLRVQVQSVISQYSSCGGCAAAGGQAIVAFRSMASQFFSSVHLALQAGQQHYGHAWQSQFKSIFQQCSSAFVSLKTIATSLHVDLTSVIQSSGVNLQVFSNVGLNLSALLQLNLNVNGLIH